MQTIQQLRAAHAMRSVRSDANKAGVNRKEYKSYAAALPAMIHMNGLGQTAAFYRSKSGTHKAIYEVLSSWLIEEGQPYEGFGDLLDGIVEADMDQYRLAQAEAQALMEWVKKFSIVFMEFEDNSGEE